MSGFGDKLRREREMRGVSLEEIAESTKIGTRSLRALEDEDFEKLPGGIFNRGFVRAYSRFLGLDEEQTVADFDAAWKAHEASKAPPPEFQAEEKAEVQKSQSARLLVYAVLLLLLSAGSWLWLRRQNAGNVPPPPVTQSSSTGDQPRANPSPQSIPPSPAVTAPAPSTSQGESASPPAVAEKPSTAEASKVGSKASSTTSEQVRQQTEGANDLSATAPIHLEVFAREDSWLSVSADGKSLGQGILAAQKSRTIRAQREVHLRVGNVAAVEVSFNGRPINIDGEPKQVKDLIFTPDGLRQ